MSRRKQPRKEEAIEEQELGEGWGLAAKVEKGGIVCKTIMEHPAAHMTMEAGLDERRARLLQESREKRRAEGAHFSSASSSPATSPAAASAAVASTLSSPVEFGAGEFVQRGKENKAGEMSATADASVRSRPRQISGPPQTCRSCGCYTSASSIRCAGCAAPLVPPPPKAPEGKHAGM